MLRRADEGLTSSGSVDRTADFSSGQRFFYDRQNLRPRIRVFSSTGDWLMFGLLNKNKVARQAQPTSHGNGAAGDNWQSILSRADAGRERYRDALAALNVKVICELAPLVRDRSKYESFRHEAKDLALSIQDEFCRRLAIKQVEGLSRRAGERNWGESMQDGARTPLI
jgi:hypothetical protein